MRPVLGLVFWLAITFAAAAVGARYMPGDWYAALRKPPWTPPGWIFAPVWTILYVLMAVAAWLVWKQDASRVAWLPLGVYVLQLALNAAWSWCFFGLHSPGLALADIGALWLALAATVALFWAVRPLAGALLLPYLAWVTFASALNAAVWWLNRG
jgi:tryptophan-rich sensory protein